jgi:hypothetical protein
MKHGRNNRNWRTLNKICQEGPCLSFWDRREGGVKPSAPCRKILQHIKDPCRVWQRLFVRQNSFAFPVPPALLQASFAGRIARDLWWTNQEFPLSNHSTMVLDIHISSGGWTIGPLVAAVQRHGLTHEHDYHAQIFTSEPCFLTLSSRIDELTVTDAAGKLGIMEI